MGVCLRINEGYVAYVFSVCVLSEADGNSVFVLCSFI